MTTKAETTKREAIRKAWVELVGELNFNALKLDDSGWSVRRCKSMMPNDKFKLLDDKFASGKLEPFGGLVYRPKSLQGIENNNGWFSIEEHGLPKEDGDYEWFSKSRNTTKFDFVVNELGNNAIYSRYTHYRPIEQVKPPLY